MVTDRIGGQRNTRKYERDSVQIPLVIIIDPRPGEGGDQRVVDRGPDADDPSLRHPHRRPRRGPESQGRRLGEISVGAGGSPALENSLKTQRAT